MASRGVSPRRRRLTNLLALVVVAVLAATVWQTWDFWREAAGFADRRAARRGRGYPPPGFYGRGPMREPAADELDWELQDRVWTALEIQDQEQWEAIEPKVRAVVRLQEQLPESKDPLGLGAPPRPPVSAAQPTTDEVTAVRDDRARLRLQLKQARDALRKSVTRKQEAALVLLGLLD